MKKGWMELENNNSKMGISPAFEEKEVIDVIRSNNLGICAVVESHVKVLNLKNVCVKTFGQWDWVSNNNSCKAGTRIIVGWNPRLFDVMMISQSKQVIHCYDVGMYLSFIYAASNYLERRLLWDNLKKHSLVVKKEAWGLLGDFNVALKPSEYSEGCSKTPKGVEDFVDCLSFIEVEDLNSYGFQFTWNKTPAGNKGLLKKLDRVMVNLKFISDHPLAHVVFKPYRNSDHCPAILNLPVDKVKWKPSFRFANFIAEKEEFLPLVKEVWDINIDGFFMFKIREEHANILFDFNVACNDEEKLLAQRAKIKWLQEGDNNSKFFHRIVKSRGNSNRIQMVLDEDGRWVSGKAMKDKFVSHFNKVLGCKEVTELSGLNDDFFHKKLDSRVAVNMIRVVFDIDDNRAPSPDGYSSKNFKSSWNIVGPEVCKAVREFFWSGKLLKGINATRIVLVPKVEVPRKVSDFRPIACCNTFYKCISKIIVNRIRNCLGDIVSKNQSAFIPSRSILDNILLAQELMGFGFYPVMVQWIMACVSSPWFMLNFNEIMGILKERENFKFHSKCMALNISHLCFADDLLVFSYGNGNSVRIIRDALDEFKKVSGLKWVRINYIGSKNFWDILQKKSMRWTWKRFLEIRKIFRPYIISCVGNGRNTSLWHDWWHPIGILSTILSRRDWVSNGFSDSSLVSDVLDFDTYSWPVEWVNKFPGLKEAPMFCIDSNMSDVAGWRDKKGVCKKISCKQVWKDINNFGNKVPWHDIVWIGLEDGKWMLCSLLNLKSAENLIIKCMLASSVAHIWRERNSRLFSSRSNSVEGVIASIENEIRLKLLGFRKRAKMWRKFKVGDPFVGIWWGYFWNKCLYKGIDGICYWLENLFSNHNGVVMDGVGQELQEVEGSLVDDYEEEGE
ncbi:uncharacterized protein LOC111906233 [Lactuca sativa]|uniref:uncharacterized protein LOC111906233 n=1 Tax=Lactuca sativa TaxID=4236 RepID=UPI0022AE69C1|nr:uncharacterized protein LOC111906233 [Lactuca sativa]